MKKVYSVKFISIKETSKVCQEGVEKMFSCLESVINFLTDLQGNYTIEYCNYSEESMRERLKRDKKFPIYVYHNEESKKYKNIKDVDFILIQEFDME